jgi:soluble lytic murein transglycosylase-like protein
MKDIAKREWVFWSAIALGGTMLLVGDLHLATRSASEPLARPATSIHYDTVAVPVPANRDSKAVARSQELVSSLLVEAIVQIESSGRPRMVGRHGERGLMQIKSGTWADMTKVIFGQRVSFDKAFDPDLNRKVGTAYLAFLQDFLLKHKSEWKADERSLLLACYNAGPNRVREAGFSINRLPRQARDYVSRGSALHQSFLANHDLLNDLQLALLVAPRSSDS